MACSLSEGESNEGVTADQGCVVAVFGSRCCGGCTNIAHTLSILGREAFQGLQHMPPEVPGLPTCLLPTADKAVQVSICHPPIVCTVSPEAMLRTEVHIKCSTVNASLAMRAGLLLQQATTLSLQPKHKGIHQLLSAMY